MTGSGFSPLPAIPTDTPIDAPYVKGLWAEPGGAVWGVGLDVTYEARVLRFD
jgi:hypothetical protein